LPKLRELIKKEHYGRAKQSKDDLKAMSMGMFAPKGRMRFAFGTPIETHFELAKNNEQRNDYIRRLAEMIDDQIYKNYKLWPSNFVAYDMLMQEHRFKDRYTAEEQKKFEIMVEQAMVHIDFPITDIQERFLKLYAYPVINKFDRPKKQ
jgi:hypothetical protein